jgi:hypothetical protein
MACITEQWCPEHRRVTIHCNGRHIDMLENSGGSYV